MRGPRGRGRSGAELLNHLLAPRGRAGCGLGARQPSSPGVLGPHDETSASRAGGALLEGEAGPGVGLGQVLRSGGSGGARQSSSGASSG